MELIPQIHSSHVLHWNYRGFTEFPLNLLKGEEKSITDIYLKENLISKLPSAILTLEKLESLYLGGNDINELPKELGLLKCLKCLDLSGNRLERIPEEIGNLKNLKYLILDDNYLRELPLRIADLKRLRYLSVCDNRIAWLPQRPVHNYYHCEVRFWRNRDLRCIPFGLWYHMFKDQQTRCLDLGCLGIEGRASGDRCILKLHSDEAERKIEIPLPKNYTIFQTPHVENSASLLELCMRKLYSIIHDVAKRNENNYSSIYDDRPICCTEFNILDSPEDTGTDDNNNDTSNTYSNNIFSNGYTESNLVNINKNSVKDDLDATSSLPTENAENFSKENNSKLKEHNESRCDRIKRKDYKPNEVLNNVKNKIENFIQDMKDMDICLDDELIHQIKAVCETKVKTIKKIEDRLIPKDLNCPAYVVEAYFYYLPEFLKKDLRNGPVSRCENVLCKIPVFDNVCLRFALGKMKLIDSEEDVVLSAVFCSNHCAYSWSQGRDGLLPFKFEQAL